MSFNRRMLSVFVLLFGLLGTTFPQTQSSDQPNQGVKGDVQDAGHSTKRAAKKTGHKEGEADNKKGHKQGREKDAPRRKQGRRQNSNSATVA
jgi:hypothetical protein